MRDPQHLLTRQQQAIDDLRATLRQAADALDGTGLGPFALSPAYAALVARVQALLRAKAAYYGPDGDWQQGKAGSDGRRASGSPGDD